MAGCGGDGGAGGDGVKSNDSDDDDGDPDHDCAGGGDSDGGGGGGSAKRCWRRWSVMSAVKIGNTNSGVNSSTTCNIALTKLMKKAMRKGWFSLPRSSTNLSMSGSTNSATTCRRSKNSQSHA